MSSKSSKFIHISKSYQWLPNGQVVSSKGTTYAPGNNAIKRARRAAKAAARSDRRR